MTNPRNADTIIPTRVILWEVVRIMIWVYLALGIPAAIAVIDWIIKDAPGWSKTLIILLVVASVTVGVFALRAEERKKQLTKYAGVLKGPSLAMLSTAQETYPKLKLGNSNTFLTWQGPEGEALVRVFDDNDLTIWTEKTLSRRWWKFWSLTESVQLKVSTKIRDTHGELVAEIIGNEWKLRKENLWDRNYDNNALEARDDKGDVVLQIVLYEDYVQFAAKMHSQNGAGFGIGSAAFTEEHRRRHEEESLKIVAAADGLKGVKVGDVTGVLEVRPPSHPLELVIQPIFRYPSDLHLGERIR